MRKKIALFSVILLTLACQIVPTPPPLRPTPRPSPTPPPSFPATTPTTAITGPVITAGATRAPGDLTEFPYRADQPYASVQPVAWQPAPLPPAAALALPAPIENLANPAVIAGLTLRQQEQLLRTGFLVLPSQETGFDPLRRRLAVCFGQPYFLTTDAAFYAIDQALDRLTPTLEKEELHRRMIAVVQATLDETLGYLPLVQGGALEADALLAAAYLGVALRLLDPQAPIDPRIEAGVNPQVDQILAGRGQEDSTLLPGYQDDFRAYRPGGHYTADPDLQAYFRGMAWLNRAIFRLDDPAAGQAPLVITLALRRARIDPARLPVTDSAEQPADAEWARLRATISFLHGSGPDYGPAEYAILMDQVYSPGVTVVGLADERLWERFRLFARELPPEQVGAASPDPFAPGAPVVGWRWMSHGFRMDETILRRLDAARQAGSPLLPSPLELMSVLGSTTAGDALTAAQPGNLGEYTAQIARLAELVARQGPANWTGSVGGIRLHAFRSQLVDKGVAFATPMHAPAWRYKDLNSALGGWVHLRREPASPPAAAAADQPTPAPHPVSAPAPAYVEPNPEVFYRLALLATTLSEGLTQRGMVGIFSTTGGSSDLRQLVQDLLDLGDRLQRLGDIAAAELTGTPPDAADWALITASLDRTGSQAAGQSPCAQVAESPSPAAELIELRSPDGLVQYAATGGVDRIFVLARIADELLVTQGGVFSYYEFPETRYGPLDTGEWRRLLVNEQVEPPGWAASLYLPEGNPVDVLAFRIDSSYRVTTAGGRLNLRREPGREAAIVQQLTPGAYFTIIDGPVQAQGFTWWQVRVDSEDGRPAQGWLVENQIWYERAW